MSDEDDTCTRTGRNLRNPFAPLRISSALAEMLVRAGVLVPAEQKMIRQELVKVEPMKEPKSLIFFLDFTYEPRGKD